MKVEQLHVRLFKAFNYDFLYLHDSNRELRPWDTYKGVDYPYISVPLDGDITCIVGANESGKSQLLDAVEYALGKKTAGPDTSCRYAKFFGADGDLSIAQFGLTLSELTESDVAELSTIEGLEVVSAKTVRLHLFREGVHISVFVDGSTTPVSIAPSDVADLEALLPAAFTIDTKRELPDSVPIRFLLDRSKNLDAEVATRRARFEFVDALMESAEEIRQLAAAEPIDAPTLRAKLPGSPALATLDQLKQFELAYDLLVTVGGVAPSMFDELHDALRAESEGLTTAIIGRINDQLSRALNMAKWWSQDTAFELQVDTRDFDLVFTIRDRTAAEYMFAERSSGLKYFLSYLVQYLAQLEAAEPPSLLLMDEPDAYLSHQGQQDLLALFQDFVSRDKASQRQVVFVTHSPFLIDRNRPERIRVLDKGIDDEGTRVVRKASHNHFEPLRSAFGGFVGETAFIGNCNLIVEGLVDQVYIAGLCVDADRRRAEPTDYLDLNRITIVAAGGAGHVPYVTYLARGRDHDQPAVIVLLDGDGDGDLARELLEEGIRKGKDKKPTALLNPDFITQLGAAELSGITSERVGGPLVIEDLVPLSVLHEASLLLAVSLCETDDGAPTLEEVRSHLVDAEVGHIEALDAAYKASASELRIDKLAVARAVIESLSGADDAAVGDLRQNFATLFRRLRRLQVEAEAERRRTGAKKQVGRAVKSFIKQHDGRATRDEVRLLLLDVHRLLDDSRWADDVRVRLLGVERELNLKADLADDIADYPGVVKKLEGLLYAPDLEAAASGPDLAGETVTA